MRRIFIAHIFLYCLIFSSLTFSQISTFDTSYVICTSNQFDFENPKTLNVKFSGIIFKSWLVYEKKTSAYSNIVIREMTYSGYGPEIMITNDVNCLNINPSFDYNFLVWQSNKYGNWDIFCSYNNNGSWSQPTRLDSASSDETEPYVLYNNTGPIQYSFCYLTFRRDDDIGFKKYKVTEGYWAGDTNITTSINEVCINPIIIKDYGYHVCFLKHINDTLRRITYRSFAEQSNPYYVTWQNPVEIYQPKSQENLENSGFLTYDYDTINAIHTLRTTPGYNYKEILTWIPGGKNMMGEGIPAPIIPYDSFRPTYFHFMAFTFIRKNNDSTMVCAAKNYSSFYFPPVIRFYVGDDSLELKYCISPAVYTTSAWYKARIIWEKVLNNKMALVETYMTDFINNINSNTEKPYNYKLHQNYPNPFNPKTNIKFDLPKPSFVNLIVYDVTGSEVTELVNESLRAGTYQIDWDASDYPSGVYFYRLSTEDFSAVKKMLLIK